jgi:hypothetical protein
MRARIGLLFVALTATAGCAAGTPSAAAGTTGEGHVPSIDVLANGRIACQAVKKTSDAYVKDVLQLSGEQLGQRTQVWSAAITRAARGANDDTLRTALQGLADVVRGWAVRPPDRTGVRGFQHDLDMACRSYLTTSGASAAS